MARQETAQETTIARPVAMTGRGLHTGTPSTIRLAPAPAGTGVVFRRTDLSRPVAIPASTPHIAGSRRGTDLSRDGVTLRTVEHILAAIVWCGVDDVIVEVDGEEIPLGDGSALPFVELIEQAGLEPLEPARSVIRVVEPLHVAAGRAQIVALPHEGLRVTMTFVGRRPGPTSEHVDLEVDPDTFKTDIAPARTIGFGWELDSLRSRGLALGASIDQAVIVGDGGYVGPSRYPDEAARHKVLDLLGDLALAGRVAGHFIAVGSGHALNHELARVLAARTQARRDAGENG